MARERPSTYLHTNTNTQPRGFGWRIHCCVEVTVLSTSKQHTLSLELSCTLEQVLVVCLVTVHAVVHGRSVGCRGDGPPRCLGDA